MNAGKYRLGDKVYWELAPCGSSRWLGNRDLGSSGSWIEGVVTQVDPDVFYTWVTQYLGPSFPMSKFGPMVNAQWWNDQHCNYDPSQWSRPDFLALVPTAVWLYPASGSSLVLPVSPVCGCECGAEKVYGKGGVHSSWCPVAYENLSKSGENL